MAFVYGQLESLKKIRKTLDQKGISRFNSLGQLNKFIENYEKEKEELFYKTEQEFENELNTFQIEAYERQKSYDNLKTNAHRKLNERLHKLEKKCSTLRLSPVKSAVVELGNWYVLQILLGSRFILRKSHNALTWIKTNRERKTLKNILKKVNSYNSNKHSIISTRFQAELKKLEHIKSVVDNINPLIAGAIGEHLVAQELKKLSDPVAIFNDFSLSFNPPIFKKDDNDRIYSVQIDHLLITKAGIFIIETKNWSKDSIERSNLRSPIKFREQAMPFLYI